MPDCSIVSPGRAECPADGRAQIWTAGGDDDVRLGRGIRAPYFAGGKGSDHLVGADMRDFVDGGQGADDVSGRGAYDRVYGFTGNDRVSGGSGDDLVNGGTGFDRLFGGAGSDTLDAFDGHRDKRIDCGGGEDDLAYVDPVIDPAPLHCEAVRYQSAPSEL